ncbi:MAG TPA: cadmium-translocating P-type ATPase [Candidatus Megamonas gallistercoris]|nr:cadmium-translocating P-type ATPase [Candidatus Megamonas gallistercoris]
MTKKQRKLLNRIIIAAILFVAGMISPYILPENQTTDYVEFAVFLASYAIIGWDIIWKALCNIRQGQIFDENFLMMIATVGAFILGEHSEGVAVMLFYQVGEWFQSYAVAKSRKSITSLMDIRPDYANVQRDGKLVQVDPDEVQIGEIITVKPGEKIPIDGIITSGTSSLDTSALTGESLPREAEEGMEVISGCINQTGILTIKTTKEFGESTVAKILDLVENSSEKKARTENFITRFARYYTPIVVFAALALAVIPPLVTGDAFAEWVYRALTFLVISCPCALVISIPLSFFGGLGGASKCGVLVKGSNYLETLADTEIIVFDKTGTLTKGSFAVSQIYTENIQQNKLLEIAAYAENYSNHPISASIKRAYNKNIDSSRIQNVQEIAGHGVSAVIDGKTVLAGNAKLMKREGILYKPCTEVGTVIYVAVDNKFVGYILIEDEIKEDAAFAINQLKDCGIKQTVMLTGDSDAVGKKVARRLGLDRVYTQLLPADKVERVEELLHSLRKTHAKGKLAFVGDGINDAPVLARADVGIAMGGLGSDAAIEAADIVLMTDEPSKIATAKKIAKKTLAIAYENIVFAIGIKLIVLVLGALGFASMWAAVFADVGVSVIAILNAIRVLNVKKYDINSVSTEMKNNYSVADYKTV